MKALFLTNEYPPRIYGGAGVHVEYLSRELARRIPLEVRCFGDQNRVKDQLSVLGFGLVSNAYTCPEPLRPVFGALQRCLDFNTMNIDADIVHCHTWYSHFGGLLAKINYGLPLVVTVHSLEPLRPWKREQLGGGYDFTCWLEKTTLEAADAVIAVSEETRRDVLKHFDVDPAKLHIIYNGIDPDEYQPASGHGALKRLGINPHEPYVLFVGRITRQKGIIHLVNAIRYFDPGFQVVLCAGAPDTPEIAAEMKQAVAQAQRVRPGVIWIEEMLDNRSKIELYTHAGVFVCPSIYEPFGIINLEAMACGTAVVASAVGGIPEVVRHGQTGFLVCVEQMKESPFEPLHPERFSRDLAERVNELMADPKKRMEFGRAGRQRAVEVFSWSAIADQTLALYERVRASGSGG
ncbi:MAG: glycogen synthase [Terrimicrobiaceae bacterium]|nr:glycogen synthase [Terrimicrobiaceae bacterium]